MVMHLHSGEYEKVASQPQNAPSVSFNLVMCYKCHTICYDSFGHNILYIL